MSKLVFVPHHCIQLGLITLLLSLLTQRCSWAPHNLLRDVRLAPVPPFCHVDVKVKVLDVVLNVHPCGCMGHHILEGTTHSVSNFGVYGKRKLLTISTTIFIPLKVQSTACYSCLGSVLGLYRNSWVSHESELHILTWKPRPWVVLTVRGSISSWLSTLLGYIRDWEEFFIEE